VRSKPCPRDGQILMAILDKYFLVMSVDSMGLEEIAEESEVWALASS
jgi:hypothetical protein